MEKMANLANTSNGRTKTALEADLLKALPELIPSLKVMKKRVEPRSGAARADLTVEVVTPPGRKRRLWIEVKPTPTPGTVRESLRRLKAGLGKEPAGYPVLASFFVTPRVREICREEGAGYLDLAGNCFLQMDDLYMEKVVDKNPFPRPGRPASLFSPVSSRILRAMLEEPKRTWVLRELSEAAQVSLGQASKVCRRLSEEEYAGKTEKGIQLTQPGKLLDAWREQYALETSTRKAYYSFERVPEQLMAKVAAVGKDKKWRYAITSFAAASLIAPFVRGVGVTPWYVSDAAAVELWVKALDLRPVESGPNVRILIPYDEGVFYGTQSINSVTLVGNIQLYLDLYANPARGREQAEFLREQKMGF